MKKKDNIGKDARNKAIARKMHQKNEDAAFKQTNVGKQFQSAWSIRNHKRQRPDSKDVDQILSVLEIVNKEALKTGHGGGIQGPANRMLNGINMVRSKGSHGPLSFLEDPYAARGVSATPASKGVRSLSNYKAELVRHNIVTRTDLMKLYHPPLKKNQMPHKDPFLTRCIVPRPESSNGQNSNYGATATAASRDIS